MGIQGLLPLLKSIQRPTELKRYAGETLGVDGYGWLHRGAVACAIELAQGKPTRKYVDFAMHRVKMFRYFGVTPYIVFDGDFLPSKAKTEESRKKRREEAKKVGLELLRAGKPSLAFNELQKAIDVTPEMARHLIEELKKEDVPYVVAPYEADAQLVYLERKGIISGIVSEDSDLLVFGAKRLLTKLDQHGQCVEINRKDFCLVREISLTGWTDSEFRHMAIFSGCDYLEGLSNIGLKTAYRLIRKHKTPDRIVKMLRFDGKYQVPQNYLEEFKQAELTFLHQRVFCPEKKDIVFLTEPDPSLNIDEMPYIGAPIETELARAIAVGDVNPITKQRILVPLSPQKRTISQALAPASAPRTLGKPIDQYFKERADYRRIPLGEMDPNCFQVDPNREPTDVPRPIVFPLPRPYVEGAEEPASPTTRNYVNAGRTLRRRSEPISKLLDRMDPESSHRRQTVGPSFQVYRDPTASTTPPKKARLCEEVELPEDRSATTLEKSKFFPSKKEKQPAQPKDDFILRSDDSFEEALRTLPEHDAGDPKEKPAAKEIAIFEEQPPSKKDLASALESQEQTVDDAILMPASSPIQQRAAQDSQDSQASATPLADALRSFSYEAGRPQTRIVRGLPTPASSMPSGTPKIASPTSSQTPLPTPLQRIGARALQRSKPSKPPVPLRKPVSNNSTDNLVNPAMIPLPRVDLAEIEALNRPLGSEDQLLIPASDDEDDGDKRPTAVPSARRLDLSRFRYC
ncbi:5'-_3' double-stranded DNA exonuclease-like protein [Thermochaetoides thermophila DSM 1495]|uniref:5'->3' double-stranded DNA exonuclease-like protein n=1 Tax=Chaetomium thermophilum (strain DSM 1495 / CBS 144.50 / IMI 039719) TaxID=759272 RepID=G0S2I6_CHATD|nr:5'->3' double-stranded DNA exonuclease-like protein [Thermochaetoides thermophila DSM 1495]EGS22219.1 5'->3' double-stranded DNA exonuclease-like protein [Thermochaetoides thermophila DSM 1495]